jgi:glycosyltransferase involved in cell wall biosynthesis
MGVCRSSPWPYPPTRTGLVFLEEAVRSVLTQTLRSCEAVVDDDASSDGTREWLAGREGERVRVVRLEEQSERSHARNRGLEKARGTFVLFLDDDDRLRVTALEHLRRALATNRRAIGAVGAKAPRSTPPGLSDIRNSWESYRHVGKSCAFEDAAASPAHSIPGRDESRRESLRLTVDITPTILGGDRCGAGLASGRPRYDPFDHAKTHFLA